MKFTYYGDLLGVSGYYKLSSKVAYDKLNLFYNTVFSCMREYCHQHQQVSIQMFSDSLLIWGDESEEILIKLQEVYLRLINKGLLLRGSIVEGKLQESPRLTVDNFNKFLPKTDHLARAVGLESTQKGARLLIEPRLAEVLLRDNYEWMTHEGYINDCINGVPISSIKRRISPTPDNQSFELLYFWATPGEFKSEEIEYSKIKNNLKSISQFLQEDISMHYRETLNLLKRSELRDKITHQ